MGKELLAFSEGAPWEGRHCRISTRLCDLPKAALAKLEHLDSSSKKKIIRLTAKCP
jgi:hypothetical protein